jgi:hypothetical protein
MTASPATKSFPFQNAAGRDIACKKYNGHSARNKISGGKLSAGTYVYSLLVNGEFIDSKKMILTH